MGGVYFGVIFSKKIVNFPLINVIKFERLNLKDKDYCPLEIIKGLTDKGQFQ